MSDVERMECQRVENSQGLSVVQRVFDWETGHVWLKSLQCETIIHGLGISNFTIKMGINLNLHRVVHVPPTM